MKRIEDFIVGPEIKGNTAGPLNCIKIYLAKKGQAFYKLKVLLSDGPDEQTREVIQGKMLIHNEYLLLENLKGFPGVEQCHGMHVDYVLQEKMKAKRITLVLDPFSDKSCENWMNINHTNYNVSLQEYISHRHKMTEREGTSIIYFNNLNRTIF